MTGGGREGGLGLRLGLGLGLRLGLRLGLGGGVGCSPMSRTAPLPYASSKLNMFMVLIFLEQKKLTFVHTST